MTRAVTLPLWLAVVVLVLAAWAAVDRLLVPAARWLLRRRVNRVLEELSTRLKIRIPPFKLTRREILISRLVEDPQIERAAEAEARASGASLPSLRERVRRYAVEIVPAFNAYLYFRVGYAIGRNLARRLYRVRLGYADEPALAAIPDDATVVFLINHRSNMDYLLVAYLVAERAALSYAVGEWARIWPLQVLIRSMGAYFVRRNSKDSLYRKVLERYVAMATEAGVTQAVFPEGGLSRDGRLRPPKLGILDYMVRGFDPRGERDVVFIPTGINYDRTLEDRTLLAAAEGSGTGKTRAAANTVRFVARNLRLMASNSWHRFGYACVNFGAPVSLRAYLARRDFDFRGLSREEHSRRLEELARELMQEVARVIPVVPVALVASVFVAEPSRAWSELELKAEVVRRMAELEARGAHIYVPRRDQDYAIQVGLRMLTLRHLVSDTDGIYRARAEEMPLLTYYASSIAHLFA